MPFYYDEHGIDVFYSRAEWKLVFLWIPKRCEISGKLLWLTWVQRGRAVWTGPGDPVIEDIYHDRRDHLVWILKKY